MHPTEDTIAKSFTHMFNYSVETGILPENWKSAKVTTVQKKWRRQELGNHIPIGLSYVVYKTMEKLVKGRLITHLEMNNLIGDSQHGFWNKRSCLTTLLDFYAQVKSSMAKSLPVENLLPQNVGSIINYLQ